MPLLLYPSGRNSRESRESRRPRNRPAGGKEQFCNPLVSCGNRKYTPEPGAVTASLTSRLRVPTLFLALPLRTADNAAEVHALELWILVRQHICLHIAECCLGFVPDAVVKGLDDVFLKVLGSRIRGDDCFAISAAEFRVGDSENIHLDAVGQ